MARKKQYHDPKLPKALQDYANSRTLDYHRYSPYHMRISDGGYCTLDVWTTGKYYVLYTDYSEIQEGIIERGGEKGQLKVNKDLNNILDSFFFPEGLVDSKE